MVEWVRERYTFLDSVELKDKGTNFISGHQVGL